ncbi:hypothetical protein DFH07DRAFT_1056164 [Mycena maculata]|uniref:Uncharacterized protein n=1 Tax=Mycena maculata TaxID=230809 RepID=A0AAD7NWI8_9AGAR|nr:hypothetical protein DFH07DRAFT_1056164 [Mycena maculata]
MAIPPNTIIEAASRAYRPDSPIIIDEICHRLEWVWGLEYGVLEEYLSKFFDPQLVNILIDDDLIPLAHPDLIKKIFLAKITGTSSKPRIMIQELYQGCQSFEYLVLPVDPASGVPPRVLSSSVPPHLTICSSVGKILKRWGYSRAEFDAVRDSLIELVQASPPAGSTFIPNVDAFINMQYLHETWSTCSVSSRFLGLEDSDGEEESDEDTASSTMEWEIETLDDEPQRRLLPHEFEKDPVLKIRPVQVVDDDDEVLSQDSYITGVEDPEEYAKASLARGDYDRTWLKGMEQWVQGASAVVDDQMLLNDSQIEEDSREQPRVATSLDLDRPDYLSRHQARTTT